MYIEKIELKDFRNYESLSLQFDKNVNLIIGKNANGKTNLIEGIYLSSLGKSFRTNKDNEMISFNKDKADIKVYKNSDNYLDEIEIIIEKSKKNIIVNNQKIRKTSDLLKNVYVVIFNPDDLVIVKEDPEKRRKFIDRELCQIKPSYYDNLNKYKKILLQRNTYLKENIVKEDILDVWNLELAKYGSLIIHQRKDFIDKLNTISNKIHKSITNDNEELIVKYDSNVNYIENIKEQEEYLYNKLKEAYKVDLERRTTTIGPHKDDLALFIKTTSPEQVIDARKYGSQGQQRTVALSLKLSEIDIIKEETNENPILLLDDVLSELDINRQELLIKSLKDVQLFITTSDISSILLEKLPKGKTYIIEHGTVNSSL